MGFDPGPSKPNRPRHPVIVLRRSDRLSSTIPDALDGKVQRHDQTLPADANSALVSALGTLLDTADPRGVTDAYIAARLDELAKPRAPSRWQRFGRTTTESIALFWSMALAVSVLSAVILGVVGWTADLKSARRGMWYALAVSGLNLLMVGAFAGCLPGRRRPLSSAPPLAAAAQISAVVRELRTMHYDLAATVMAKNDFSYELIEHATTRQRYKLKQLKNRSAIAAVHERMDLAQATNATAIADQRQRKVKYETAAREAAFPETVRRTAAHRVHEAEARAEERARTAEQRVITAEIQAAQRVAEANHQATEQVAQARHEATIAQGAARQAGSDAEHLRQALAAAEQAKQEALDNCRQIETLQGELHELRRPAVEGLRRREEQLERRQHSVQLARHEAEAAAHRAEAKQHRKQQLSPEEELIRRVKEGMRKTVNKSRAIQRAEHDAAAHLARIAAQHGEDSDQHRDAAAMFDEALLQLREEIEA